MSKMLEVTEGDYAYTHDLPVEYEEPEDVKRRQKRNASRKHRAVESARRAEVPLYAAPRDTDGVVFDPAEPMSKLLTVAEGDYTYAHELPVEYETLDEARRRRKRNSNRKYLVRKSALQVGVPLYDEPLDTDGVEFDLAEPTSKVLRVANGDLAEELGGVVPDVAECATVLAPPEDFWDRVADRLVDRLVGLVRQSSQS